MHFGATLRLLRIEAGLSLRELAQQVGVSGAYLSRVENGVDPVPTPDRLIAIAQILGVPSALLLDVARQSLPAMAAYLDRVPPAGALFLDIARRNLTPAQVSKIQAFIESEFPMHERPLREQRRLSDLLTPSRVVLGLSCGDMKDLIDVAVSRLPRNEAGRAHELARLIHARELETSSALGNGFAVPHAIVAEAKPAAVLVTLAEPLAIRTPDGRALRAAVVLISNRNDEVHLELLARVARLASYDIANEVCAESSPTRALTLVQRYERW
jgi:PTS system nitrogen regulatory IIA component